MVLKCVVANTSFLVVYSKIHVLMVSLANFALYHTIIIPQPGFNDAAPALASAPRPHFLLFRKPTEAAAGGVGVRRGGRQLRVARSGPDRRCVGAGRCVGVTRSESESDPIPASFPSGGLAWRIKPGPLY